MILLGSTADMVKRKKFLVRISTTDAFATIGIEHFLTYALAPLAYCVTILSVPFRMMCFCCFATRQGASTSTKETLRIKPIGKLATDTKKLSRSFLGNSTMLTSLESIGNWLLDSRMSDVANLFLGKDCFTIGSISFVVTFLAFMRETISMARITIKLFSR